METANETSPAFAGPRPTQPGASGPQPTPPETDLWVGRTSWKHYIGRVTLWAAMNVTATVAISWIASSSPWLTAARAFWIVLTILLITGGLLLTRVFLHILGRRYRLTTQRLFIETGILSRTIDQTELIRIDDVRVQKTLFDRVFGLGTISLLSTDLTDRQVTIDGVAGAEQVGEQVRSHMRALRGKAVFVETL